MSGLYNAIFGTNPHALRLLEILGLSPENVPRFRDCFINADQIVIHTRTGGANRDSYDSLEIARRSYPEGEHTGPWNADLQAHKRYQHDEDDPGDSTYANFFFQFPPEHLEEIERLRRDGAEQEMPAVRWKKFLKDLKGKKNAPEEA